MSAIRTMGLAPTLPAGASVAKMPREYLVSLAITGFARPELEVELTDHTITIRGDQHRARADAGSFRLHEKIEESFELPADVETDRVTATFGCGLLEIHAPRTSSRTVKRMVPITRARTWSCDAAPI